MRTRVITGKLLLRPLIFGPLLVGNLAVTNGADPGEKAVSSQFVIINGEVLLPHRFTWTNGISLTNIVTLAGGFTDFADREKIEVCSAGRTQVCSYAAALKTKNKNIVLSPGDKVYVPRSGLLTAVQIMEGESELVREKVKAHVDQQALSVATVHYVKRVRSEGTLATFTFEITNHTADTYTFVPVAVEVRNQVVWKECLDLRDGTVVAHPTRFLAPQMPVLYTFDAAGLPLGPPLRVRLEVRKATKVSPTYWTSGPAIHVVSDEFVEERSNEQGNANSQK
jgi:hypothetical protein